MEQICESMPDLITDQFQTIGAAVDGCDVILGANAHQYAAPSIAEHAGIGCVTAVYAPVAFPSPDLVPPPTPGQPASGANAASVNIDEQWRRVAQVWNERALERINRNRARLGLAPIDDVLDHVLTNHTWLAADAVLAPVPATPGRAIFQTGTWILEDRTPLPPDLEAFLANGKPPIVASLGSMPSGVDSSRQLIGAARAVGRRIIVSRGWADLDVINEAPDCLAIGDVSHDKLFPRVAAVIHHGGAGTTATAARAGVPQVITPMFSDQFYWASRIVALGAGATTPYATMTEEALAGALRTVCDSAVAERARRLAAQIGSNGAEVAARRLDVDYGMARS